MENGQTKESERKKNEHRNKNQETIHNIPLGMTNDNDLTKLHTAAKYKT